jgi:hypothetical protein
MKVTQNAAKEESAGTSYLDCFRGTNLRRTIITIMPLTIQAMSGVAYISGYGTYYFQLAGISTQKSFQIACGAQALSIIGNIGAFLIIDRVGRRPLLLWAFGFLTVLLCVTGGLGTQTQNRSAVLGQSPVPQIWLSTNTVPATVALTVFYNFAYNFAIGAVSYAIIAETATSSLRAKTIGISSTIQSSFFTMWQFVLPFIFNPNAGNLGARTSFIFGGLSVLCWIYLYFYQPETARRSFEEIDEMFAKHVPARKFAGYRTNAEQMGEDTLSGIKNGTQHFEHKNE